MFRNCVKVALKVFWRHKFQGYREGHGKRLRKRRVESRNDGFFWGLVSVIGVVAATATLEFID